MGASGGIGPGATPCPGALTRPPRRWAGRSSKSSAAKVINIEAFGVQVELPDGWDYVRVSKQHRLAKSDSLFAYLTLLPDMPTEVLEPISLVGCVMGGKIENLPCVRVLVQRE